MESFGVVSENALSAQGEPEGSGGECGKNETQGIDVTEMSGFSAFELFGSHVSRSALADLGGVEFTCYGGEAGADFAGDLDGLVGRQATDATEQAGEVFTDVVDTANVGVGDLAGDADFGVEAFEPARA